MSLLVNIDVEDLEKAIAFYTAAFDLRVGRRFDGAAELVGESANLYLLALPAGSSPSPRTKDKRRYDRHWTPVHLDFAVDDLEKAVQRAKRAGATVEADIQQRRWGRIAMFADPFGNGFCILQFTGRGYDEIAV